MTPLVFDSSRGRHLKTFSDIEKLIRNLNSKQFNFLDNFTPQAYSSGHFTMLTIRILGNSKRYEVG